MKTVIIGCAGGGTSSLLCASIRRAAERQGLRVEYDFLECRQETAARERCQQYRAASVELLLLYGAAGSVTERVLEELQGFLDGMYIAPQVRYLASSLHSTLAKQGLFCKEVDMQLFGLMDGRAVLQEIRQDTRLKKDAG